MKSTLLKIRKLNNAITKKVIELQDQGYLYDFMYLGKEKFLCLQDSVCFYAPDVSIKLIDINMIIVLKLRVGTKAYY